MKLNRQQLNWMNKEIELNKDRLNWLDIEIEFKWAMIIAVTNTI